MIELSTREKQVTPTHYDVPFERSYWVIPPMVAAGCYPGDLDPAEADRKLRGLIRSGIRCVINLMEEDERNLHGDPFIPYTEELGRIGREFETSLTWVRMPIRDYDIPSYHEMAAILNEIDNAIVSGRPVFIHCLGGKGRTGTVVGCYLARHGIACGQEALDAIRYLRRNLPEAGDPSPENDLQRNMVLNWKEGE